MEQRLYDAAVAGEVNSLLQLIEEDPLLLDKVNLYCQDKNPLHIAAMLGHADFVKAILRDNSDMCLVPDRFGRNPLHLAAIKGRLEVLKDIIHATPPAAREKTAGGDTVLHLCIKYNQLEALKNLVESIQDHEFFNMKNGDGMTMLHLAIYYKQNETIEYLLQNNIVDVNAKNANGNTALDLFQGDTNSQIARSLETAGAKRAKEIDASAAGDAPKEVEWLTKKRDALMVVAILIATMAFQAGVSPPGGVWQEDYNGTQSKESHKAGEAVMGTQNPYYYKIFFVANTVAFVSSLSIILLLISGLPFRRNKFFMWVLMAVMWLTITTIAFAYAMSLAMLMPADGRATFRQVNNYAVEVWYGVMGLLLLGNIIRLLNRWLKFRGIDLLKKIKPANPTVQEQTNDV